MSYIKEVLEDTIKQLTNELHYNYELRADYQNKLDAQNKILLVLEKRKNTIERWLAKKSAFLEV